MKKVIKKVIRIMEILMIPLTLLSAFWMKILRIGKARTFPMSWKVLKNMKVIPIIDHYYDPLIDENKMCFTRTAKNLPGVDFNLEEQLVLLESFIDIKELDYLNYYPDKNWVDKPVFYFENKMLAEYDSKVLYSMIRYFKPSKIIEIGSGFSTLMSLEAIKKNKELHRKECEMICIEPYENPWLSKINATVIRKKVEEVDIEFFKTLNKNDILFIDSSHIIRPSGDVLFEYLEILPQLNKGVVIHIHDIFTPNNYLYNWMFESYLFWNEQYLLEAFLTNNEEFKIVMMCNYLKHFKNNVLAEKLFVKSKENEPGSFWIQKIN